MLEYDPYAYAVHEDPYPLYARLRREAPVYRNEELGFWAFSRHEDVLAAFKDHRRFSNREGVSLDPKSRSPEAARIGMSFLGLDPPHHTRMRGLVSRGFTPRRVAALEPRIREMTVGYLDRLQGSGGFDVIDDFAGRLPMDVISELLGVPAEDRRRLREWADLLVHREEGVRDVPPAGSAAFGRIRAYFTDLLAERRQSPREDLLSVLTKLELDGDHLEDTEILSFCNLMIVAGNETTTKLIGNALYWLALHPDQRRRMTEGEAGIEAWVEETLRYDNSTQMLARLVTEDVEVRDQKLKAGDLALLLVGSANRDEQIFENADVFDLQRDTSAMLSFGKGAHFCMGASLARLEARVALEEWWSRFSNYTLDPIGVQRVHSINVRGFSRLPVKV